MILMAKIMRKKNFINQMLVGKQLENLCQFQFSNRWLHEVLNFQVPYLKNLSLQHHILAIFCQNGLLAHKTLFILFWLPHFRNAMPEALCWNDFRHFYFNYNDMDYGVDVKWYLFNFSIKEKKSFAFRSQVLAWQIWFRLIIWARMNAPWV